METGAWAPRPNAPVAKNAGYAPGTQNIRLSMMNSVDRQTVARNSKRNRLWARPPALCAVSLV